jgi:hypothetical protein
MAQVHLLGAGKSYDTNEQVVEKGQVIRMEGYSYDRFVVYDIVNRDNGLIYKLINLRTYDFDTEQIIRPLSEKFGIGYYFDAVNPSFKTAEELAEIVKQASDKKEEESKQQAKAAQRNEQLRVIGQQRLEAIVPQEAKAVIIAELRENDSDPMTDYYGYSTQRTVILGFSTHTKDLFSEMRKYAASFEETAYLAEENKEHEHREKYSMGAGYYLGKNKYSGWIIKKEKYYKDRSAIISGFALTAGTEENICVKVQAKTTATPEIVTGDFIIVDYSEKALAVFGDTRPIKDQLKALGGRFNPKLTHENKKKAGWIFSKSKEQEIKNLLTIK